MFAPLLAIFGVLGTGNSYAFEGSALRGRPGERDLGGDARVPTSASLKEQQRPMGRAAFLARSASSVAVASWASVLCGPRAAWAAGGGAGEVAAGTALPAGASQFNNVIQGQKRGEPDDFTTTAAIHDDSSSTVP